MVQIRWTLQAKNDLKDIYDYISKDSKKYAQFQVLKIKNSTMVLRNYIYAGKMVGEVCRTEIREIVEGNYRIKYKINNNFSADILTIHHSAKNLAKINFD